MSILQPLRTFLTSPWKRIRPWLETGGSEPSLAPGLWVAWLAFVFLLGMQSWVHVVWRDEVRALNIAMDSRSFLDLFIPLAKDGHPRLWHALLWLAYRIFHATWVLKACSLAVAAAAAWIFLRKAAFSIPVRILFIFGIVPFYEYGVMNRNYGVSMLLLFLWALIYPERCKKILPLSLLVFLLAQTNVHSLMIGVLLFAALAFEWILEPNVGRRVWLSRAAAVGIMLLGFGLSWWQVRPEPDYIACNRPPAGWSFWIRAAGQVLENPGFYFQNMIGLKNGIAMTVVLGLAVWSLARKPALAAVFALSAAGLGLLFETVYPGAARHQGLLFVLYLTLLWMARRDASPDAFVYSKYLELLLVLLLLLQTGRTVLQMRREFTTAFSSAQAVGRFLQQPAWKDAVLVGEPDFTLESLPYYAGNRLYIPRERRFGRTLYFTAASRARISLEEILASAQAVKNSTGKPVLLALGHILSPQGPFQVPYSYNKIFTYSPESLAAFTRQTRKVASFQEAVNENCDLYEVK